MSGPNGEHFCRIAEADEQGYAFCPLLKRTVKCGAVDEDCPAVEQWCEEFDYQYQLLVRKVE